MRYTIIMERKKRVHHLLAVGIIAAAFFIVSTPVVTEAVGLKTVTNLKTTQVNKKNVTLAWKKQSRARFYQVKISEDKKSKMRKLVRVNHPTRKKKLRKLQPETTYYLRVRAARKSKRGRWSKWKRVTTEAIPDDGSGGDGPVEEDALVLKNLLVDFAPWDPETDTAGAFIFRTNFDKVFFEFGAVVTGPDGPKTLSTFEYIVDEDADLYAPMDAKVNLITYQEDSSDYEIHLKIPNSDSQMTLGIDHVLNPTVAVGDVVSAGDVIGNPGTWSTEGFGRTEIEIFGDGAMHCAFEFFDTDLQVEYEAKVTQMMSDWETFKGDDAIYDESAMADYAEGCIGFSDAQE